MLTGIAACEPAPEPAAEVPTPEATEMIKTPEPTEEPAVTLAPTPTPTDTPTPEPTPEPTPAFLTLGAVGDVMVPSGIVNDVRTETGDYDFTMLFAPVKELFESVDLMCANLEAPLAGAQAGYSAKREGDRLYRFNAPDSVLDTLKADGVDLLTTANNHCLDKGKNGLFRTIETIRAAGFYHTGTFLNAADREKPLIIEKNGIRLGVLAATRLMNQASNDLSRKEERTVVGYMDGTELCDEIKADIARVREAGAEFVVLFAHWDYENDKPTDALTRKMAAKLLAAGVDGIIGSHPHRIKGAEFLTVERENGPYTGLVLYSLGNFTANQEFVMMVGLFARITLKKDFVTDTVTVSEAEYLPTYVMRRAGKELPRFTVVPTYENAACITGLGAPLEEQEIAAIARARALGQQRLGAVEGLRLMEDPPVPDPTPEPSQEPTQEP